MRESLGNRRARRAVAGMLLCIGCAAPVGAATWYVAAGGSDVAAGTNWVSAKATPQAALDLALAGDTVLVSNGTYAAGGRVAFGVTTNRIAIPAGVTVRSVNGPGQTLIVGNVASGSGGGAAVRCAYLGTNAVLAGFTLTNGHTVSVSSDLIERNGGAAWCEPGAVISNCILTGSSARNGGAGFRGSYFDCVLVGNSASLDGGCVSSGTLFGCTLAGNAAGRYAGAALDSALSQCVVSGNAAALDGGGAQGCALFACTLSSNTAGARGGGAMSCTAVTCTVRSNTSGTDGGGAAFCDLENCWIEDNRAVNGGGTRGGTLANCVLTGNRAGGAGGGAFYPDDMRHCTVTGNSATNGGGVIGDTLVFDTTLLNCIVYYNEAPSGANFDDVFMTNCCTTPLPAGSGNLTNDPALASASHLSLGSPCGGAGRTSVSTGVDIDGEPWSAPPSMGCDEVRPGFITGPIGVEILASYTNVMPGYAIDFTAVITGRLTASVWDFADGTVLSNRMYVTHAYAATGTYSVVLRAFNETYPGGVAATVTVVVVDRPVLYVAASNATPVAPYQTWATAAAHIQDAIDAAHVPGSLVLVSNGVYSGGGRVLPGSPTNRIAITKPIEVTSVNGPAVTFIVGGSSNGPSAVRCAYVGTNAFLSGFTLTNGRTLATSSPLETYGGGAWCEDSAVVSNCLFTGNAAVSGGGAYGGTLVDCELAGNSAASKGGGVHEGVLLRCLLARNGAVSGGGASDAALTACQLVANVATSTFANGGGAHGGALWSCTLISNTSANGGGVYNSVLTDCRLQGNLATKDGGGALLAWLGNCTLMDNVAAGLGGGANGCAMTNCALVGNAAGDSGGGSHYGTLRNCTLTGNTAAREGGGAYQGSLRNCLVYYNQAPTGSNYLGSTFTYSCTAPPAAGTGNVSVEPVLASATHLASGSPLIGACGSSAGLGADIDGEPWAAPASMGCDEVIPGAVTGPLQVAVSAAPAMVIVGYPVDFLARIEGRTTGSRWDLGDGTVISNRPFLRHAYAATGLYPVVLTAVNEDAPAGWSATTSVLVVEQPVHHVALSSASPVPPYATWATAATNIQDAIDAASLPGALVLVSNGTYATGGRVVAGALTNRIAVTKPIVVRSVNGPQATILAGAGPNGDAAVRCAYLGTNAMLAGFTLSNGHTRSFLGDVVTERSGGGAWCDRTAVLSNCVVTASGAAADGGGCYGGLLQRCTLTANTAQNGGGVSTGVLYNCLLVGNTSTLFGAGSHRSQLHHCTVARNAATSTGGGAYGGALTNCIVYDNTASSGPNYGGGATLAYSCASPLAAGTGNLTNAPLFVATNNFRLGLASPCRDAGTNQAGQAGAADLDGLPRPVGGRVDMGAYEHQGAAQDSDGDQLPDAWEIRYGFDAVVSNSAHAASDADWMTDGQEYVAGTDPTNAASYFPAALLAGGATSPQLVMAMTMTDRVYQVLAITNLQASPQHWSPCSAALTGTGAALQFALTNALPFQACGAAVRLP
jgi:PKD repeat protein